MPDDAKDFKRLLWAIVIGLALNAAVNGFVARESHQANVHAANAERTLQARDFDRIYRENAELRALVCSLPELKGKCEAVR